MDEMVWLIAAVSAGCSVVTGIATAVSVVVINRTNIEWIKRILENHNTRIERLESTPWVQG